MKEDDDNIFSTYYSPSTLNTFNPHNNLAGQAWVGQKVHLDFSIRRYWENPDEILGQANVRFRKMKTVLLKFQRK